jgi:basic membrane protein A
MIKKVDVAVFETARAVAEGRFQGGLSNLGLADDGVGYVFDENNADRISEATVARVRELAAEIVAGEREVPER